MKPNKNWYPKNTQDCVGHSMEDSKGDIGECIRAEFNGKEYEFDVKFENEIKQCLTWREVFFNGVDWISAHICQYCGKITEVSKEDIRTWVRKNEHTLTKGIKQNKYGLFNLAGAYQCSIGFTEYCNVCNGRGNNDESI